MSYNICPWALLGLSVRFLSYRNLESATNYFYNKIEANIKNMDLSQEPFLKSLFELDNLSYKDKVMTAMDIFLGGIDAVRLFIFFCLFCGVYFFVYFCLFCVVVFSDGYYNCNDASLSQYGPHFTRPDSSGTEHN